jgi:fatty acid desaturase
MDKQGRKAKPPPQRRVPPPEGSLEWLTEDIDRPRRPHFSIWRAFGILAALIAAYLVLGVIFGPLHPATCLLAIPLGLALYELWYLLFETSV